MTKARAFLGGLFVVSFVCCASFAQTADSNTPVKPLSVQIVSNQADFHVGGKAQFKAIATYADGKTIDARDVTWSSAPLDTGFADSTGTATFFQPGRLTLVAVVGGKTGYLRVNVLPVAISRLDLERRHSALSVGSMLKLTALPRDSKGVPLADRKIQWSSSNPAIATVDPAGLVVGVAPGTASITANSDNVTNTTSVQVVNDPVGKLSISPSTASARTGDVVHFTAKATDKQGAQLKDPSLLWSVSGAGARIWPDGGFVAEEPGTYVITTSSGQHQAVASITVSPRNAEREIDLVGHISLGPDEQAAEEWIIGNHAYLATISDQLHVFDIADPANPRPLDTLKVDARLINDVSTTPDERMAVFTREAASNRKNGIVFVDVSDPAHLKVLSEYTTTVTGGVHSAFINSHYVYLTDDATGSLRVIDFQDVKAPKEVARFEVPGQPAPVGGPQEFSQGRYLHDLQVKDGLAYLAYWRDGLVVLDVGNGMKGGSPEHPQIVTQYKWDHHGLYGDGWIAGTHTMFRYKNYLFVGDEVFPDFYDITDRQRLPIRGVLHVLEVSDIEHPREVAQYEVPEGASHNFWVENDVLYAGYYGAGGRVLDVSGELRGDLYRQGREIGRFWTGDPKGFRSNLPMTWGGQPCSVKCSSDLLNGLIYFNDINSGLWIAKLGKPKYRGSTTALPMRETENVVH